MRIIIDSNRFIAALIKDGLARTIISSRNIAFYNPEYVLEEVGSICHTLLPNQK